MSYFHQQSNRTPECIWLHSESLKLHPVNWVLSIFGCSYSIHFQSWKNCRFCKLAFSPQDFKHLLSIWEHCMLPDKILPVERLRWAAKTGEKQAQEKRAPFSICWFEWPDSNHAKTETGGTTAVVLGERTGWREDICSPQRVTSMSLRRRCVWTHRHERGAGEFLRD